MVCYTESMISKKLIFIIVGGILLVLGYLAVFGIPETNLPQWLHMPWTMFEFLYYIIAFPALFGMDELRNSLGMQLYVDPTLATMDLLSIVMDLFAHAAEGTVLGWLAHVIHKWRRSF